ncbi:leucyl/phenylalanyl-tRNA--protein transferase [Sulfurimonas sp. MAG313]|nr:leucyl/phenylalanyl-tRNA--protein transferase [Sulfurimonas sp. MAG313]
MAYIQHELSFPCVESATQEGLLAYGGDLSANRLLLAYRSGIFPWYNINDPILWWSPNPRLVLFLDEFILRKSLKKRMKHFEIKYDTAFMELITECGKVPRDGQDGSWIIPEIVEAYSILNDMGYAHSIEAWQDGELVGGLYGVAIGKMFFGESMFAKVNDASKVALATLIEKLQKEGFSIIDCQVPTQHLKSLGAREISRQSFINILKIETAKDSKPRNWT